MHRFRSFLPALAAFAALTWPGLAALGATASGSPVDGIRCDQMEGAVFHIHPHLAIFDKAKAVEIPSDVGRPSQRVPLLDSHAHRRRHHPHRIAGFPDFTLGQFFDVSGTAVHPADKGNAIPYYVRDALDRRVPQRALGSRGARALCSLPPANGTSAPAPICRCRSRNAGTRPADAPERVVGSAVNMMRAGFQQLMQAIQDCEKPVIVAMNGTAAGGGSMLVLAADLVIAADTRQADPGVRPARPRFPTAGVAYLLPRVVGMHKAKELVFFGDDLSAADAATLGIVNKVVPAAELQAATKEWAERLASGPTKAIGWSKKLLHDASELVASRPPGRRGDDGRDEHARRKTPAKASHRSASAGRRSGRAGERVAVDRRVT